MSETLLLFALIAFIGIATPGPTVLLALTNGSRFGVRAALAGMAGAVLSDFLLISAVALGLGALLAASEFWFSVVKWIGVVYLAWLGLRLLRSKGALAVPAQAAAQQFSSRDIFMRSLLVAVTNARLCRGRGAGHPFPARQRRALARTYLRRSVAGARGIPRALSRGCR